MDIVPPPMDSGSEKTAPSLLEAVDDDDEDLFAVVGQQKKSETVATVTNTSGYDSADATSTTDAGNILR